MAHEEEEAVGAGDIEALEFRDIYLSTDPEVGFSYNPVRKANLALRHDEIPERFLPAAARLLARARAVEGRKNYALGLKGGMRVRVIRTTTDDGYEELCFRRLPAKIPALLSLNYEAEVLEEIMTWPDRKGLVLTVGETGSGKTTLIMSLLDWACDNRSIVILTIEDPVEFRLRKRGPGFKCIQWEVTKNSEWPEKVDDCLRFAPDIVVCGEIRTPETAAAVINLANSGHMVIGSVHGGSPTAGLERLLMQAMASDLGDSAPGVLASAITGVAFQQIIEGKPKVRFLATERDRSKPEPIREYIRSNNMKMLDGIIERQANIRKAAVRR